MFDLKFSKTQLRRCDRKVESKVCRQR